MDSKILLRMNKFKSDLPSLEVDQLVRRYITFGDCYLLDEEKHFSLKEEVATHFGVHPTEIFIVGSAKLGFSITRHKRFRPFGDTSDIDVAIVSSLLFDKMWQQVFEFWETAAGAQYWEQQLSFKEYLFRGWIRPDKLPTASSFQARTDWWDFFLNMTSQGVYGPCKITAGLYKSWYFLEKYQSICIRQCKEELGRLL